MKMLTGEPYLFEAPAAHEPLSRLGSAPQQEVAGPIRSPTVPRVRRERAPLDATGRPLGLTLYATVSLREEAPAQPRTGIFIPNGYRATPTVDLILYLHGYHRGGSWPRTLSINDHWDRSRYPYYALREEVNASGKNVILVAPTLGPRSESGRLLHAGGLDWYLNQVLAAIAAHGGFPNPTPPPKIENLILASHSGGGEPMRRLAVSRTGYAAKIRECWGFDCLYANRGDVDSTVWERWARGNRARSLYVYYLRGTPTAFQSLKLARAGLPNVHVSASWATGKPFPHVWVPFFHWRRRIQDAPFLQNK